LDDEAETAPSSTERESGTQTETDSPGSVRLHRVRH
jgi:hypothetical protein